VTENAVRVEVSGVPYASSPSGVIQVSPQETTTYTVTAYGATGLSASIEVTVTVINIVAPPPPPPPPPPIYSVMVEVNWGLPTLYSDGSSIHPDNVALIVTYIFMNPSGVPFDNNSIPVASSQPGATSLTFGPVDVVKGEPYHFTAKSELNGMFSDFGPVVTHTWE
jgi:hypothetical protein